MAETLLVADSGNHLGSGVVALNAVVVATKTVLKDFWHPDTHVQVVVPSENLGVEVGFEVDVDDALGKVSHGAIDQLALVVIDDLAVAIGVEGLLVDLRKDLVVVPHDLALKRGNLEDVAADEAATDGDVVHGTLAFREVRGQEAALHLHSFALHDPSLPLAEVGGVRAVESFEVRSSPDQARSELWGPFCEVALSAGALAGALLVNEPECGN
mmetsp:Transcript_80035/g.175568  ORF Transcript_80035/g.175568 Transcript_80035/m.175568 type:complete len:213 (+) Transcript_80035:298-936(+)